MIGQFKCSMSSETAEAIICGQDWIKLKVCYSVLVLLFISSISLFTLINDFFLCCIF